MKDNLKKYSFLALKALVALAFIAAGSAKLSGAEQMVATFDALGFGQWFRYVTGAIEVGAAILLFIPNKQVYGAALLSCTMVGAILAHWIWLGPSAIPAAVLGVFTSFIAYVHWQQSRQTNFSS